MIELTDFMILFQVDDGSESGKNSNRLDVRNDLREKRF